jgi:hypothetical protein
MVRNDMIDFVIGNVTNRSMDDAIEFVSTMVFGFLVLVFLKMMFTGKDTKGKVVLMMLAMLIVPSVTYLGLYTYVYGDFLEGLRGFLEVSKYGFEVQ